MRAAGYFWGFFFFVIFVEEMWTRPMETGVGKKNIK